MNVQTRAVRGVLLAGCAIWAFGAGSAAFAQSDDDEATAAEQKAAAAAVAAKAAEAEAAAAEGGIVVTGFRASVENSIAVKRDAPIIMEVVSADDIAGLPDVSIAEALARLPGVAAQRGSGQASAINIRGLTPELVTSSLDGREQVATSGLRTIEFEQYPSELVSQAAVYKSPMASLIEGGIAGRVELKTARPPLPAPGVLILFDR